MGVLPHPALLKNTNVYKVAVSTGLPLTVRLSHFTNVPLGRLPPELDVCDLLGLNYHITHFFLQTFLISTYSTI